MKQLHDKPMHYNGTAYPVGRDDSVDWGNPKQIAGAFLVIENFYDNYGHLVVLRDSKGKEWALAAACQGQQQP